MMNALIFLNVDHVREIHSHMIDEFGGSPEVRDEGLLASAVAMPAMSFGGHYLHESLAAMAAAYLFHICKNHPFVGGNKRAAGMFLWANGRQLRGTDQEWERITIGVADSSICKAELTELFRESAEIERI